MASILSVQAQTLNPTPSISSPNSADNFKGGYTFSYATAGTPWDGSLISYGGFANNYDSQINSDYLEGKNISFRTRNGDTNIWNPWIELATRGINNFKGDQVVTNGSITSSITNDGGGHINLENPSKTSNGIAKKWTIFNMTGVYGNSLQFWAYDNLGCSTSGGMCNNRFTIMDNGNVGVGTSSPSDKLSVLGGISKLTISGTDGTFDNLIKYGHKSDLESGANNVNRWHGIDATITAGRPDNNKLKFKLYAGGTENKEPIDVMTLVGNGNVGIGTTNPTAKLTVAGDINSREVRVTVEAGADFVFENDYDLPSLNFVESFIKENKHLPQIASAKEMQENGINLSEMNIKLLQKIEEMTLYMIEQNKKILVLEKQNEKFSALERRLEKMENGSK
ncbi:hypothetical protein B0A62_12930 [Flavobacterium hydatis]|uniref:Cell wall anchor protein n=2 Tax=Flavobacterium hydatis TaxID=991 RepID=A0ABX4CH25_FLAHY|nr:hypothetical protein B0A62_12930 [Flavobacterium hydatis]